jgi:hypothetical protein
MTAQQHIVMHVALGDDGCEPESPPMTGVGLRREEGPGSALERQRRAAATLLAYCLEREWAGHDPYDALNTPSPTGCPGSRSPSS